MTRRPWQGRGEQQMTVSPPSACAPIATRLLRLDARQRARPPADTTRDRRPAARASRPALRGGRVVHGGAIATSRRRSPSLAGRAFCQRLATGDPGRRDDGAVELKDLTSELPDGLVLAAVLDRADPRDVLISRYAGGLDGLPHGPRSARAACVAGRSCFWRGPTWKRSSCAATRHAAGQSAGRPNGPYDAAILAAAGVERMGWAARSAISRR